MFSPFGMPSYIAIFARDKDRSRDHMTQPLIKQLCLAQHLGKEGKVICPANIGARNFQASEAFAQYRNSRLRFSLCCNRPTAQQISSCQIAREALFS